MSISGKYSAEPEIDVDGEVSRIRIISRFSGDIGRKIGGEILWAKGISYGGRLGIAVPFKSDVCLFLRKFLQPEKLHLIDFVIYMVKVEGLAGYIRLTPSL